MVGVISAVLVGGLTSFATTPTRDSLMREREWKGRRWISGPNLEGNRKIGGRQKIIRSGIGILMEVIIEEKVKVCPVPMTTTASTVTKLDT
jgi:hypothetical protein